MQFHDIEDQILNRKKDKAQGFVELKAKDSLVWESLLERTVAVTQVVGYRYFLNCDSLCFEFYVWTKQKDGKAGYFRILEDENTTGLEDLSRA